jgi:hypothetical protein
MEQSQYAKDIQYKINTLALYWTSCVSQCDVRYTVYTVLVCFFIQNH